MKYFYVFMIMFYFLFGLTGIELAEKMENRDKPIDSKTDLIMTLTNKKGNSFNPAVGLGKVFTFVKLNCPFRAPSIKRLEVPG